MKSSALLLPFGGKTPVIGTNVLLCPGVVVTGDVEIGTDSSLWFNTVARGDVFSIHIGERTNIQDISMLHVTTGKYGLEIGNDVTVGHSAILHGCIVRDRCLIGMGARVLDRAVVHSYSIVAAGSVVREGFVVPEGVLVAGVPAKIMRELTDDDRIMIEQSAAHYVEVAHTYREILASVR